VRIFGLTLFAVLFPKLHQKILAQTRLLSLTHPLNPNQTDMYSLTDEESLAVVAALGDAVVSGRQALAESQAALAEVLKVAQPLAERNAALQGQVDALHAANQKFADADAKLDAALGAERDRLNPPAEPVESPVATIPVTDEAGSVVDTPAPPAELGTGEAGTPAQ
jgi:hypothetical protein